MRALIQRVQNSSVTIDGEVKSSINKGLLVLLGIEDEDNSQDIDWLSSKIVNMRIFNDEKGVMNKSVIDHEGEILVVSQFTLHASTKKGNRPGYTKASKPGIAIPLYEEFVRNIQSKISTKVQTGEFGADMKIALLNDGPVTIWVDTKNKE